MLSKLKRLAKRMLPYSLRQQDPLYAQFLEH